MKAGQFFIGLGLGLGLNRRVADQVHRGLVAVVVEDNGERHIFGHLRQPGEKVLMLFE